MFAAPLRSLIFIVHPSLLRCWFRGSSPFCQFACPSLKEGLCRSLTSGSERNLTCASSVSSICACTNWPPDAVGCHPAIDRWRVRAFGHCQPSRGKCDDGNGQPLLSLYRASSPSKLFRQAVGLPNCMIVPNRRFRSSYEKGCQGKKLLPAPLRDAGVVTYIQPRLIPHLILRGVIGLVALAGRTSPRRCQPQLLVPTRRFHEVNGARRRSVPKLRKLSVGLSANHDPM